MITWMAVAVIASCTPNQAAVSPTSSRASASIEAPAKSRTCVWNWRSAAGADALLHDRYSFSPHPTVVLPSRLTWREDPLHDLDWTLQFQSLRWADPLLVAWKTTHSRRYLERYLAIIKSWLSRNADRETAVPNAWDDHSTAWRAMTLACAYETLRLGWIRAALEMHGRTLAAPGFYVGHANHALNQNLGLLAAGCALGRVAWTDLAARRIDSLAAESIDPQGATNEQSVGYEAYNYARYTEAVARLRRCGRAVPRRLSTRLALMPRFLAQATMPNGRLEPLGDSEARPADVISGTEAAFAESRGKIGEKPSAASSVYTAGYAFGRTGWGENRPFTDESFYSMRWGEGRRFHGHSDGTAVTLYGFGSRLLLDPGKYSYDNNRWRSYFQGPSAHNLVTIDGVAFDPSAGSELITSETNETFDYLVVRTRAWQGVTIDRHVLFSRALGYMVVEDEVRAERPVVARQLWHLAPDADPFVRGTTASTRRSRGNVTMTWLGSRPDLDVLRGRTDPIQGWVSFAWRQRVAAPVFQATQHGRTIRFVTVIVPSAAGAKPLLRDLRITTDRIGLSVTVDGTTQAIEMAGKTASLFESHAIRSGLRPL